jgi:hypothetical protein
MLTTKANLMKPAQNDEQTDEETSSANPVTETA